MFTATPVVRIFLAKSQGHFRVLGQVTSIDNQHLGSLTFYQTNSLKLFSKSTLLAHLLNWAYPPP